MRFSWRALIGCLVQESPKRVALLQNLVQTILRKERPRVRESMIFATWTGFLRPKIIKKISSKGTDFIFLPSLKCKISFWTHFWTFSILIIIRNHGLLSTANYRHFHYPDFFSCCIKSHFAVVSFYRYLSITSTNESNGWYGGTLLGDQDENSEIYRHYAQFCQVRFLYLTVTQQVLHIA